MFTDPDEECVYHPGPPEFHEGQKGEHDSMVTFSQFCSAAVSPQAIRLSDLKLTLNRLEMLQTSRSDL
jgi:hypothetical protein